MPRFAYTARDSSSRTVSGGLDATSRREALKILQTRGLHPLQMTEEGGVAAVAADARRPAAVEFGRRENLAFFIALSELTHSGLSAGEAVRLLSQRLKEHRLRALSQALWDRLSEGQTLSRALADFPQVFDRQSVSLLQAAEATGSLNEVLERLIEHYTEQKEMRQKLVTALAYPVFVCLVALGVIIFFVLFLLPRLQTLLASLGSRLPVSTLVLVGLANGLMRYGIVIVPLVACAVLLFWRWTRTEAGRTTVDGWLVTMPFVRHFVIDASLLNFSSILAVLLENGIPTSEALRLTERTVVNRTLQAGLHTATDRVMEGEALSVSLGRTGWFPDLVLDRLAVGESTGKLAPCLRDIARNYAAGYSRRLQALTQIISSAVLLFAFTFVGFIAYAIVSAVLQVSSGFKF